MTQPVLPNPNQHDEQLTLVARLYYVDGLGQGEVARLANVSQAKVSRWLAQAKQRGIVKISVAQYEPRDVELEAALKTRLGLSHAIVIKSDPNADDVNLRKAVGYFGGKYLHAFLHDDDNVAIAGGRTISETVKHLPTDQPRAVTIIQAMGHVDAEMCEFDAQEVGRSMAQRTSGSFVPLNAPAFIPDKAARDVVVELEQVRGVRRLLRDARVAIVGIGSLQNSVFVQRGTLTSSMIAELHAAGAIGEICGRFFDFKGEECATPWADRVVSISLDELRNIPLVMAVSCGNDRSAAIHAAARGGLINGLLIDVGGARALLEFASQLSTTQQVNSQ